MKILLIASFRCGSYSLLDWLSEEFNLKVFGERDPVTIDDDYIVKRVPSMELLHNDNSIYDHIIRLYRIDTMKSAESNCYAIINNEWRTDGTQKKYELDETFLTENHDDIMTSKINFEKNNQLIKKLNLGALVTYEEIFEMNVGQAILEEYIGFKAKTNLNIPAKKFRKESPILKNYSYELELKKLKNIVSDMNNLKLENNKNVDHVKKLQHKNGDLISNIKRLKNENDHLKEIYNDLQDEMNDTKQRLDDCNNGILRRSKLI